MSRIVTLPPEAAAGSDGTKAGGWWQDAEDGRRLLCRLCPRGCSLAPGDRGFCFVRQNRDGQMISTTYGRSTGLCVDPIEKKPLFQFYPGTAVLSFGTAGCNLGCKFCQNWTTTRSQDVAAASEWASPEAVAEAARRLGCRSVAFTYNDPIVWAEYAIDTARACRAAGVKTVAVTSGYISAAARGPLFEQMDAANVDLKGFDEEFYRKYAAGHLQPVLDTLRWLARESQTWLEITNLIIPQANDSADEIGRMCRWIAAELGLDVPLHFTAFHPAFQLNDRGPTPPQTLELAHDIARQAGLRYVYTGNTLDPRRQTTYCPGCGRAVVGREGYLLGQYQLRQGRCTHCGTVVAGRFDDAPGNWGGRRMAIRIDPLIRPELSQRPAPPASPSAAAVLPVATTDKPAGDWSIFRREGADVRSDDGRKHGPVPLPAALSSQQEQAVFQAAGRRVIAAVRSERGGSMAAALADAAGLRVYGTFVSLKRQGQLRSCCGFLGQEVSLCEALDRAAVRAAKDDPRFPPISAAELPSLSMEVWLLWGPEPILARGPNRIAEVTIGKHGLQIARGAARGLLLPGVAVDYHLDAKAFLEQVCLKAGLPRDAWLSDDATLTRFEGYAIRGQLADCMAGHSAGSGGGEVRPPAVAGAFYPGTPHEVRRMVEELFAAPSVAAPQAWAAALVPHAGWIYSGRLAAAVLQRVAIPEQVIVLCPRHHPGGAAWAVAPYQRWSFPGGEMASDPLLAERLAAAIAGLELDAVPHRQEHAIEVHLPLLARLAPQTRIVGITIGAGDLAGLRGFGQQLAAVLGALPERPLLLISSDMNHFADDAQTRRLDRLAIDALEHLDAERLWTTVHQNRISMCGMMPAVVVLETLRGLDRLRGFQLVGYATSAEVSGDMQRVVGYAGALLGEPA
ncbi:MAG: AmmeMemoRadiSam system radical SAM enzyme [Thermoguttaceae bacterium]